MAFKKISDAKEYPIIFNQYKKYLLQSTETTTDDIHLFAYAAQFIASGPRSEITPSQTKKGIEFCKTILDRIKSSGNEDLKFESIIIYYWLADLSYTMKDESGSLYYVNKTLEQIEKSSNRKTTLLDEKGLKTVSDHMIAIKNSYTNKKTKSHKPLVKGRKYRRNEKVKVKYSDGSVVEDKFKKLEKDITSNICELV